MENQDKISDLSKRLLRMHENFISLNYENVEMSPKDYLEAALGPAAVYLSILLLKTKETMDRVVTEKLDLNPVIEQFFQNVINLINKLGEEYSDKSVENKS